MGEKCTFKASEYKLNLTTVLIDVTEKRETRNGMKIDVKWTFATLYHVITVSTIDSTVAVIKHRNTF